MIHKTLVTICIIQWNGQGEESTDFKRFAKKKEQNLELFRLWEKPSFSIDTSIINALKTIILSEGSF